MVATHINKVKPSMLRGTGVFKRQTIFLAILHSHMSRLSICSSCDDFALFFSYNHMYSGETVYSSVLSRNLELETFLDTISARSLKPLPVDDLC